jgi:glycosyltransferase involved in cell wall biosynthesis
VTRARAAGVPTIVTLHDYFAICPWFFRMRNDEICRQDVSHETCTDCVSSVTHDPPSIIEVALRERNGILGDELHRAAARLTLSEDQTSYLRHVPAMQDLEIEPILLPQPDLEPTTRYQPAADGRLRIVSWGGLVPGKGMLVLVRACEALAEPERVEVHHYGRAIDAAHAAELGRVAKRTRLVLHGVFDTETMPREFPRFDLAVFPSLFRETWGYAVDEALALGLPVVVPGHGAPRHRVGDRGVVFPAGDVGALTAVIEGFLADPRQLSRLRAAEPPSRRSLAEHWAALEQVYSRVAVRPSPLRQSPEAPQQQGG